MIGYIGNLSNIQQGNEFAANQLSALGQQIGQAINLHSQTQAAQAMLPSLQSQVQQGMDKISKGDPTGLSDVYGAATSASQIPVLAPMGQQAVNMANMAYVQVAHNIRTQSYLAGKMASLQANMATKGYDTQGNPIQGWQPPAKNITPYEKQRLLLDAGNQSSRIWSNIQNSNAEDVSPEDIINSTDKAKALAQGISQYTRLKAGLLQNGIKFSDPNFENALNEHEDALKSKIDDLTKITDANKNAKVGTILGTRMGGNLASDELQKYKNSYNALQQIKLAGHGMTQNDLQGFINNALSKGATPEQIKNTAKQKLGIDIDTSQLNPPAPQQGSQQGGSPSAMLPEDQSQGIADTDDQGSQLPAMSGSEEETV